MPRVAQLQRGQLTRPSPGRQPPEQKRHWLCHCTPRNPTPALQLAPWVAQGKDTCLSEPQCFHQTSEGAGEAQTGVTWAGSQPKPLEQSRGISEPDTILLGGGCPHSNLENPGAQNVPPGHLTKPLHSHRTAERLPSGFCGSDDSPAPPPSSRTQCEPGSPYRVCSEAITESPKRNAQTDGRAGKQASVEGEPVGPRKGCPCCHLHKTPENSGGRWGHVVPRGVLKVRVAEWGERRSRGSRKLLEP